MNERTCPTCQQPVETLLNEHINAAAAFYPANIAYHEMEGLCRNADGLVPGRLNKDGHWRTNGVLDHYAARLKPVEDAYWQSLHRLDDAMTVEIVVSIKETLALAGITAVALMDEICQCVVRGGCLFDGGNLKHLGNGGERSTALAEASPALCPHCGKATDPGLPRCPHCERVIG